MRRHQPTSVERSGEQDMKVIPQLVVAAALSIGLVSCAQAHVSFGVSVGVAPVFPVMSAVPVYAPPPVYYAPPAPPVPVYTPPVAVGYYAPPPAYPAYYGGWNYGYGYWRR
jgi:hypothetical protein